MNICDIYENLEKDLYAEAGTLLRSEKLVRLAQDEERVFNAEFREDGKDFLTEVSLTSELDIEELWCNCGEDHLCRHIAAVLIGADLMLPHECDNILEVLSK